MKEERDIIPLVREGKGLEATQAAFAVLRSKTKTRINEEKRRVGATAFQGKAIPNTKGTVSELVEALEAAQYRNTKTGPGATNEFGETTLYHFYNPCGTHFRVHHLKKPEGEHIGWAHVKLTEGKRPEIGKRGTGSTSLKSYLQRLEASKVKR